MVGESPDHVSQCSECRRLDPKGSAAGCADEELCGGQMSEVPLNLEMSGPRLLSVQLRFSSACSSTTTLVLQRRQPRLSRGLALCKLAWLGVLLKWLPKGLRAFISDTDKLEAKCSTLQKQLSCRVSVFMVFEGCHPAEDQPLVWQCIRQPAILERGQEKALLVLSAVPTPLSSWLPDRLRSVACGHFDALVFKVGLPNRFKRMGPVCKEHSRQR